MSREKAVRTKASKREKKNTLIAYTFIAPNFLGFAIFTLIPLIFAFVLSFLNWDGSNSITWAGLDNFKQLVSDDIFWLSLKNTVIYAAGTVPLTMAAALGLAILLNQKVKGRYFFRTVTFFPYVASLVAVAVVWNMIFHPTWGPINNILMNLGVQNPPKWAADKDWAMFTIILFSVWKNMGYYMVVYLAGLQGVPAELYEASGLDGANAWQRFKYVTWPTLASTTFFVVIMLTINCFKVYDQVFMITQGGPGNATSVLVYYIYNNAFVYWKFGYASAISMVLFIVVLAVTLIQFRFEKKYIE